MATSEPVDKGLLAEVAEQLVSQRVAQGLEIEEAAKASGVDLERLEGAESGELALNERELERLAELYGVGVTAFFGGRTTPVSYLFGA